MAQIIQHVSAVLLWVGELGIKKKGSFLLPPFMLLLCAFWLPCFSGCAASPSVTEALALVECFCKSA